MKKILSILIFFMILFSVSVFAHGCRTDFNIDTLDKNYEVAVIAKLKSKSASLFSNKYTLDVTHVYKGQVVNEISVWSKRSETSCGIKLEYDTPYVIFAYVRDGELWITSMSSWSITDKHQKYTDAFNKFYNLSESDLALPEKNGVQEKAESLDHALTKKSN